jgi:hypothetical protein
MLIISESRLYLLVVLSNKAKRACCECQVGQEWRRRRLYYQLHYVAFLFQGHASQAQYKLEEEIFLGAVSAAPHQARVNVLAADRSVHSAASILSGHTLKHLFAVAACFAVLRYFQTRKSIT